MLSILNADIIPIKITTSTTITIIHIKNRPKTIPICVEILLSMERVWIEDLGTKSFSESLI